MQAEVTGRECRWAEKRMRILISVAGKFPRSILVGFLAAAVAFAGCGTPATPGAKVAKPAATKASAASNAARSKANPVSEQGKQAAPVAVAASDEPEAPPDPVPKREPSATTLIDLVNQAQAAEFKLPELNEAKAAAAGIRKLSGKHITIYTDLAAAEEIEELPQVFDLALPEWCKYFELDEATARDWKIVGYLMKDKERFAGAGLLPESLPPFLHGYQRGSEIWWYDQPGSFYRRELMLHEGTHAFMTRFLGGAGPPWYMEGMAEYLGTHKWEGGKLMLAYNPRSKEEAPFWGRVKVIRDEYAASRGMLLTDIMRYDARAHLKNEPYGWCWGAALFLDNHPLTQKAFRNLRKNAADRSVDFSENFLKELEADWPAINEDWQLFIVNADYGYDVPRGAVVRKKEIVPLPAGGASVKIASDRGWQSTGFTVEAGKTYRITGSGRYQVAKAPQFWPCEPGGITIHYHRGKPLGMLVAAVGDTKDSAETVTPLARPVPIGTLAEITPTYAGTLYLCINEAASGLADNEGTLTVKIERTDH